MSSDWLLSLGQQGPHHSHRTASTSVVRGPRLRWESTCEAVEGHPLHLVPREIWQCLVKLKMHVAFVLQFQP